jgi:thioredoxin reductase (NADPH)
MNPIDGGYQVKTDQGNAFAKAITICTGFYDTPRKLNVPGEQLSKVKHFYSSAHPYVGQKVLIVGAANSACDVALETYYKGARVTMAVRGKEINPRTKYWIKPNIENRIKEGAIKAYFNTTVTEILKDEVILNTPKGEVVLENDFVLAMIGYTPDYSLFERLGLPIGDDAYRTPIYNQETLESELSNVYVAGVAGGGLKTSRYFIENTRDHGKMIVDSIQAKS